MRRVEHISVLMLLMALSLAPTVLSQEWKTLLDLKGEWRIELGDDQRWADPAYSDSKWDKINVPGAWENEGFPGYDGYAWYRKHFTLDKSLNESNVYLHIGYVDDVCEVYLNGHMVGFGGEFPPNFITTYDVYQQYPVPPQYLTPQGDNVIAVRVYDQRLAGGITHGRVGLFEPTEYLKPDYAFTGPWKFTTGDNVSWKDPSTNDTKWANVVVPAAWETQGFKSYNGIAWYRFRFKVPSNLAGQRLILLLGKIDDVDETYLNGELVGKTGRIREGMDRSDVSNEYQQLRAYVLSSSILLPNQENVVAVRVSDVFLHGGIYDGPIGLIARERFLKWRKEDRGWRNLFDWFR